MGLRKAGRYAERTFERHMKRTSIFLICILLASSLQAQKIKTAFAKSSPLFVEVRYGDLVAVADTFSGRFSLRTSGEKDILFYHPGGVTSFINVKLGGRVYTSNGLPGYGTPWGTWSLGKPRVMIDSAHIFCLWDVEYYEGRWSVLQTLALEQSEDVQELKISVEVTNTGSFASRVGIDIVEDLEVKGNDGILPIVDGQAVSREREITPVPAEWSTEETFPGLGRVKGRLAGPGLIPPDRFIVGQYSPNGRLGAAGYGYVPDSVLIRDAAVMMEWASSDIASNGTMLIATILELKNDRPGTFGKEFVVSLLNLLGYGSIGTYTLTLISDTIANVRISQKLDSAIFSQNITVNPGSPVKLEVDSLILFHSITYHDEYLSYASPITVTSDAPISVIGAGQGDVSSIEPLKNLGREYIVPGVFYDVFIQIVPGGETTIVQIQPAISGGTNAHSEDNATVINNTIFRSTLKEDEANLQLNIFFRGHIPPRVPVPGYTQGAVKYPTELGDGSGTVITASQPVSVYVNSYRSLVNIPIEVDYSAVRGITSWLLPTPYGPREEISPLDNWGKEYFCTPFVRPTARRPGDLIKILASDDNTQISFDGLPLQFNLKRGGYFDTLIAHPVRISSNKPIGIYQYALHWFFVASDTIGVAAMSSVPPISEWGKRYYCIQDVWEMRPALILGGLDSILRRSWKEPSYQFVAIVCKALERDRIKVDGVLIDQSRFKVYRGYAYLILDTYKRMRIIESDRPIFVQCYGWQYLRGYAYVPPHR